MAILYQFHDGDFQRSVVEAEAAAKLVPYDPLSRADLALYLANAGKTDWAIEWLEEAIRRDASPMDWYFGNLAVSYYLADRPADAVAQFQKMERPWNVNLAAAYARLGKLDEARASVSKVLNDKPGWTIKDEAVWPTTRAAAVDQKSVPRSLSCRSRQGGVAGEVAPLSLPICVGAPPRIRPVGGGPLRRRLGYVWRRRHSRRRAGGDGMTAFRPSRSARLNDGRRKRPSPSVPRSGSDPIRTKAVPSALGTLSRAGDRPH